MSVISVDENLAVRTGKVTAKREREHVRQFTVETDNPLDEDVTVLSSAASISMGLPQPGQFYATLVGVDTYALFKEASAVETGGNENGSVWTVTVTYSTESDDKDSDGKPVENPLDGRHEISWGTKAIELPLYKDLADPPKKIVNKANDVFNPPVMRTVYRKTLNVRLNSQNFTPTIINQFVGNVNSGNFVVDGVTFGAKRVLCTGISTTPKSKQVAGATLFYDEVSIDFEFVHPSEDAYKPALIMNTGMRFKDGAGKWHICKTGTPPDETDLSSPAPMKSDGSGLINPDTDDPNFCEYDLHLEVDFDDLGLNI